MSCRLEPFDNAEFVSAACSGSSHSRLSKSCLISACPLIYARTQKVRLAWAIQIENCLLDRPVLRLQVLHDGPASSGSRLAVPRQVCSRLTDGRDPHRSRGCART